MNTFLRSLAFLVASTAIPAPGPAQTLQMKSGALLVGEITEATGDGLTYKRLDNGGILQLGWDDLSAESALKIKTLWNLSVDEESEVMVDTDVIVYELAGGALAEAVGKVIETDGKNVVVRTKSIARLEIPAASVRQRSKRQVRALDLVTRDDFYNDKFVEISPGDDADRHVLLADLLVRVRDYDRARQHLERAKELGNSKQATQLDVKLQRVKIYKENEKERVLREEIGIRRARADFGKCLALLDEFQKTYPQSKLKSEFEREKERVAKAHERWLVAKVTELWYMNIAAVADHKVNEKGVTFAAARQFAETQMGKEIRQRIGKVVNQNEDEVGALFKKRLEFQGITKQHLYSYGIGSWLLGAKDVIKGTRTEELQTKGQEKEKPKDEDMERLLRKLREARERLKKAGQGETGKVSDEDFWAKDYSAQNRSLWVQAAYVENSGDLKLIRAYVDDCKNCAGEGATTEIGDTGQPRRVPCFVCHGTKFTRRVRAE